jgi:uncharacterized protein YecE (DUF72 family)
MKVRVGLCGFSMAMARYPFPVVEVQSTFYEPPADSVMEKWPRSLEYTMKVWQLVTHPRTSPTYRRARRPLGSRDRPGLFRDSRAVARGWQRSLECAQALSATALLFQCPASFRPEREHIRNMTRFFERLERPRARLLWEPRGPAWVEQRELAISLCRDLGLVHVVDPFVTPPHSRHPVYWRLHGIGGPRYSYSANDLRRLRRLLTAAKAPGPAYVMFNNLPRVGDAKRFLNLRSSPRGRR